MMVTIRKGPYCLGDNFGVTFAGKFRLVPSSQTLSPIANGLYLGFCFIQLFALFVGPLGRLLWLL